MASLVGQQLKDTYDSLLKTSDNDALGGTYKEITDGSGNGSNLYLGTGGNVGIGGTPASISSDASWLTLNAVAGSISGGIIHQIDGTTKGAQYVYANNVLYDAKSGVGHKFTVNNGTDSVLLDTSGRVGIGETSPSDLLHLKQANGANMRFENSTTGRNIRIGEGVGTTDVFSFRGSGVGTDTLSVDFANDRVGIGTITPSVKLDIKGTVGIQATNSTNKWLAYTYTDNTLRLNYNGAGNDEVIIDSSGNVGIGTSSIDGTLHLDAGTSSDLVIEKDGGGYASLRFHNDGSQVSYIQLDASEDMIHYGGSGVNQIIYAGGVERMRIDSSGTIKGIGTYTASGSIKIFEAERSGGAVASDWSYDDASTDMTLGTSTAHSFSLKTNDTNRLTIDSSGIVQARRARSNTAGNVALSLQPSDSTIHYGFRIDSANNFLNIDRVDSAGTLMTIDSSGNVFVGKQTSSITTVGVELKADGNLIATRAGAVTSLNREDSDGTIIDLRKDGTTVGIIGTIGGDLYFADATYGGIKPLGDAYAIVPSTNSGADYDNAMSLGASSIRWKDLYLSGTAYLQEKITTASSNLKIGVDGSATSSLNISSASLYPQTDGSMNLGFGASSFRFATVFATTGTINTSDEKQKQDIEELSEAELRVAQKAKTLMKKYRMISSVEEKGDDARIHVGIIAQDLEKAFADEGLDAGRYGMFIKETTTNDDGEEQTAYAIRYNELLAFIISSI